jgi:hypothetical protein
MEAVLWVAQFCCWYKEIVEADPGVVSNKEVTLFDLPVVVV